MSSSFPSPFDDLSEIYDAMIDWPKRLANEEPFFRRRFERAHVKRVADVACGTGHHAAMFYSWGLDVHGFDVSPQMIERARASFGESERLRWTVQSFDHPVANAGPFDAVVCLGNSLALVRTMNEAWTALRHMLDATRDDGGSVIVQVLNHRKLPQGACVWQKTFRMRVGDRDALVLKGVHRCGQLGYVDLAIIGLPDAASPVPALLRSQSVPFLGLLHDELEAAAEAFGATDVRLFGNYQDEPFDPRQSNDLIMIATKVNPARVDGDRG